jgi:CubicO group peptidase (beta-lactamase class C family)
MEIMHKKYKTLLFALAMLCATKYGYSQTDSLNHHPTIKVLLDSLLNEDFNGIILVTSDGHQEYLNIRGYSNIEKEIELDIDAQFVIGSISKQITAVLVLQEYEKKTLTLNDPISHFLKNINQPWAAWVTIHHLLTHTHGIVSIEEPLAFPIGTKFQYSQLGYQLLADILEAINETSFSNLSSHLFEIHGLQNTCHPDKKNPDKLVTCYTQYPDGSLNVETASFENYVPAGSFISTASDLTRWNELLFTNSLLQDSTLALMSQYQATRQHPIFGEIDYGYGLTFKKGAGNVQIGALGFAPGFVSSNFYFPEDKRTVVILENIVFGLPNFKLIFDDHVKLLNALKEYH